jgi:acyl carrier protein
VAAPLSEIIAIVRDILRDADLDLSPSSRFDELNDWDSMDLISVMVEAECRYGVHFDGSEIERLVTVGDLMQMIESKRAIVSA